MGYDDYGDYGQYDDKPFIALRLRSKRDRTGVTGDTGWFKPVNSLYTRCTQATYWTDAGGTTWRLEDMTAIHRQNLLAWLERRADTLHQWAFEAGKISYADRGLTAQEWLLTLPLVKKLHDLTYCPTCGHVV